MPLSRLHASFLTTQRENEDFILGNCDNSEPMIPKETLNALPKKSGGGHRGARRADPFSDRKFTYGFLKDIRDLKIERAKWRGKGRYHKLFAVVSNEYYSLS